MDIGRLVFLVALGLMGAVGLRAYVGEGVYIASGSMEPTLSVGAHLVLDKVTPRMRDIRRGDIISFRAPIPPHEPMVKRVVAVEGDTVELREKQVFVNGAAAVEPFVRHTRANERLNGDTLGPLKVPSGSLFVLGDNRDESDDSSVWKNPQGEHVYFLPLSSVEGVVRGIY